MSKTLQEIHRVFLDLDTARHLGIAPGEAAEILLAGQDYYLARDTIDDFLTQQLTTLDSIAQQRNRDYTGIDEKIMFNRLRPILARSPLAQCGV